jgi:hypothetical protein
MEQMQAAIPKSKPVYDHVMIDLETLSTYPDAVILSIGAVKFNMSGEISDKCFYAVCSIDSQPERHISADTLAWWMGQSPEAKKVFDSPEKFPLSTVLNDLYIFFGNAYEGRVWSNGAAFDIPILTHAYRESFDTTPWKFYNVLCFRTMKEEFKGCPRPPFEGTQHNALLDAIHQTKWLLDIERFKKAPAKGFAAVK